MLDRFARADGDRDARPGRGCDQAPSSSELERRRAIVATGLCTSCNPELFFSHRRDGGVTGRQAGLVWLRLLDAGSTRTRVRAQPRGASRRRSRRPARAPGRDPADVELLAATKYVPLEQMGALAEAGIRLVGENIAQDLVAKQERWGDAFTFDFIGHLQSRKTKQVLPRVRLIHSVESESVAASRSSATPAGPRGCCWR